MTKTWTGLWQSVAHHLRVAAQRYDDDTLATKATPRLSEQFAAQAKEAREMAQVIEDHLDGGK